MNEFLFKKTITLCIYLVIVFVYFLESEAQK